MVASSSHMFQMGTCPLSSSGDTVIPGVMLELCSITVETADFSISWKSGQVLCCLQTTAKLWFLTNKEPVAGNECRKTDIGSWLPTAFHLRILCGCSTKEGFESGWKSLHFVNYFPSLSKTGTENGWEQCVRALCILHLHKALSHLVLCFPSVFHYMGYDTNNRCLSQIQPFFKIIFPKKLFVPNKMTNSTFFFSFEEFVE